MKHIFTFFIIPLLVINFNFQTEDFIGKWKGDDNGEIGYIIFDDEGYAAFEIEGQIMGGKEFTMNGKKGKMTYSINRKASPIEVDFVITKLESGESKTLLGIVEFTDDDTMKFSITFDEVRPSEFDDKSIILKKVK